MSYQGQEIDYLIFFLFSSKVNNANAFDTKGRTALHLAALNGHQRILETLVKNHALVCIHDGTESKQTAVHVAAANGHEQCLRVLLENTEVRYIYI